MTGSGLMGVSGLASQSGMLASQITGWESNTSLSQTLKTSLDFGMMDLRTQSGSQFVNMTGESGEEGIRRKFNFIYIRKLVNFNK